MGDSKKIFQYVQFKSIVNSNFWYKLATEKIDVDKLNDSAKTIYASYTNFNSKSCFMEIDCGSFNEEFKTPKDYFACRGRLINKNTVNEFKESDKKQLLNDECAQFHDLIMSGQCLEDPSLLSFFILLSYADLKKHNFYYWFAFPTSIEPAITHISTKRADVVFTADQLKAFSESYRKVDDQRQLTFFVTNNELEIKFLKDVISPVNLEENLKDASDVLFAFSDPSEYESPGWCLRNYIFMLLKLCPSLIGKTIRVLSVRSSNLGQLNSSLVFELDLAGIQTEKLDKTQIRWIGWEANEQGKMGPKLAAMADSMDPVKLSEHFSNLNLKLMKWRLLPELNLNVLKVQKCLLFGAGTLGCSVARNLIAWGVNHITFIDCGNVSYSNPVRQSLFTHEDAAKNLRKATTAAKRLKEVLPSVKSEGYVLQIPMPDHAVGAQMMEKTLDEIETIKKLVESHDVLFLLTDSRESRWLPTLLGSYYKKIVLTAALGFDSYLVMRHGNRLSESKEPAEVEGLKCISGHNLGCYFCNDVAAPGNSLKDRTLDQQCTVTRPGVSNIAGSLAVELLISILEHSKKNDAPAYYRISNRKNDNVVSIPEDILGIIPHSIRGYLSTFEQIMPATEFFSQCIACSENVLKEYESNGNEFLLKVFETTKYLEDVTGISTMEDIATDIIDFDEDEDFDLTD